jgi:hypothetical protein
MNIENLDLSVLDRDVSDIDDLPGFEVPPPGEYVLFVATEFKKVKELQCLEVAYKVESCIKKDKDSDPDAVVGTQFSSLFFLESDKPTREEQQESIKRAVSSLKMLVAGVAESTGESNLLTLVQNLNDTVVVATVKRRADKEDPEKFYPVVKNLRLA